MFFTFKKISKGQNGIYGYIEREAGKTKKHRVGTRPYEVLFHMYVSIISAARLKVNELYNATHFWNSQAV
jgi:hypothetical protein